MMTWDPILSSQQIFSRKKNISGHGPDDVRKPAVRTDAWDLRMKTVSGYKNFCWALSNIVKGLRTLLYCLGKYLGRFETISKNHLEIVFRPLKVRDLTTVHRISGGMRIWNFHFESKNRTSRSQNIKQTLGIRSLGWLGRSIKKCQKKF